MKLIAACSSLAVALYACGTDTTLEPPVSSVATVTVTPATNTIESIGSTVQLTAAASNAGGDVLGGKTFTWASSDANVASVNASGLVTAAGDGHATVSASVEGTTGTAEVTVSQLPVQLAFTRQPTEVQVLETVEPAVKVEVHDATAHTVSSFVGSVTLALENNPTGGTLSGTTTVAAVAGVARFEDLALDRTGIGYSLVATAETGLATSSDLFDVVFAFSAVSGGRLHTCGLTTRGTAYCWGDNAYGQLGDGTFIASESPVRVAGGLRFTTITSGGWNHTCALTEGGEAYCWGRNSFGQLGDGTVTNRASPVRAAPGLVFTDLDVGTFHTCGLNSVGEAFCWGSNGSDGIEGYALGGPTTALCDSPHGSYRGSQWPCSLVPVTVTGGIRFQSISAGGWVTCGVAVNGEAYCWGWNALDALGDGTGVDATAPTPVAGGMVFNEVSVGAVHGCGLVNQSAYCWGGGNVTRGVLGSGSFEASSTPTPVAGGLSLVTLEVSGANDIYSLSCGLTANGAAYCWGTSRYGALGNDVVVPTTCDGYDFPCSNIPVPVLGDLSFVSITTGCEFACGVTTSKDVYCWGWNASGQLGDGTTTDAATPVRVVVPN